MALIKGGDVQLQMTPQYQQTSIKARIKSRVIWLTTRFFSFWLIIILPFKLLSNFIIYNDVFRMSEILSSMGFILEIYIFSVVVAIVGSFIIKD